MAIDDFTCDICGTEFRIERYGDGQCPKCQTKYVYDENHQIELTDDQRRAILTEKESTQLLIAVKAASPQIGSLPRTPELLALLMAIHAVDAANGPSLIVTHSP
jgi:DNA-directed RNA polymerase subunit RPC12/RpoP